MVAATGGIEAAVQVMPGEGFSQIQTVLNDSAIKLRNDDDDDGNNDNDIDDGDDNDGDDDDVKNSNTLLLYQITDLDMFKQCAVSDV